jgi:hypothetical protein
MPALPRSYRNMEEFEREEIRPSFRIGFTIDDLEEGAFEGELQFDMEQDGFDLESEGREDDGDEDEDLDEDDE